MMQNNSTLRADIEAELEFEPSLDARNIGVAEKNGVCTLTGHVDSFFQKWAAERAASRVKGVRAVDEQLEVRLPFSAKQEPDQIALRAANVISWNVVLPEDAVQVKVEKHWVTPDRRRRLAVSEARGGRRHPGAQRRGRHHQPDCDPPSRRGQ